MPLRTQFVKVKALCCSEYPFKGSTILTLLLKSNFLGNNETQIVKLLGGEGETNLVAPRTTKQYPQTILRVLSFPILSPIYSRYIRNTCLNYGLESL